MSPVKSLPSLTLHRKTPCGVINVILRQDDGRTIFTTILGKAGGCAGAQTTVAYKLAELAIANGATIKDVSEVMSGHGCHLSSSAMPSCISAVSQILEEFLAGPDSGDKK